MLAFIHKYPSHASVNSFFACLYSHSFAFVSILIGMSIYSLACQNTHFYVSILNRMSVYLFSTRSQFNIYLQVGHASTKFSTRVLLNTLIYIIIYIPSIFCMSSFIDIWAHFIHSFVRSFMCEYNQSYFSILNNVSVYSIAFQYILNHVSVYSIMFQYT